MDCTAKKMQGIVSTIILCKICQLYIGCRLTLWENGHCSFQQMKADCNKSTVVYLHLVLLLFGSFWIKLSLVEDVVSHHPSPSTLHPHPSPLNPTPHLHVSCTPSHSLMYMYLHPSPPPLTSALTTNLLFLTPHSSPSTSHPIVLDTHPSPLSLIVDQPPLLNFRQ